MPEPTIEELINPGRQVTLKINEKVSLTATVYIVGMPHLQKFPSVVAGAIAMLAKAKISMQLGQSPMQYLNHMLPYAMCNMLPLIAETTKLEPAGAIAIEKLTHPFLAPIVSAWLSENFGSPDKWGPWVAVADQMVSSMLQEDLKISETVSKILSGQGIDSKTSSTAQQDPVQASPTPAGV